MQSTDLSEAVRVSDFWANVDRRTDGECWPWRGYSEDGYGRFFWRGKMRGAHELAVTFTTGEVRLPGYDTCHRCNNPICCNPNHLRFDSRRSNVADMIAAGRARPGRFSEREVIAMRERYAAGARQIDLARDFGVTNGLVSQIVRGLRYTHVGGPIVDKRSRYNRVQ